MFYFKLILTGLLGLTFYGLVKCEAESTTDQPLLFQTHDEPSNATLPVQQANNTNFNSRTARTIVGHSRTPAFTLRRRQPVQIRARADHLPLRNQMRRVHNGLPNGQQPQQPNMRLGFESLKTSKFMPHVKAGNLPFPNNGKGAAKRPQLLAGHPNAIHVPALSQQYLHNFKASPVFNGQVKVHAVGQTQKQQQQPPSPNAKDNTYPKYVKPQQQPPATAAGAPQTQPLIHQQLQHQQLQHQQQKPSVKKYPDFKQYPIPDEEKMQQHNEQHEKYLHQQKFLTPKNPIAYYQLQHTQQQHPEQLAAAQPQQNYPVQQPLHYLPQTQHQQQQQKQPTIPIHESAPNHNNINKVAFPAAASVPPKMYSVYEDNDMTELQTNNYQSAIYQGQVDKEAQEYLRFMNSDEYFLPRKEPNYKRLDDEADKRQFNMLKAQAQQHLHSPQQSQAARPTAYQQQLPSHQKSYLSQMHKPSVSAQDSQYPNSLYTAAADASNYHQDHPISRLFYQQDPTASASASAAVVRTSYQTGFNQNQFIVNSQDNKVAKYTLAPSSTTNSMALPTQPPPVAFPQLRHSTAGNRTPEPLRFEFTERDAMIGSYSSFTKAPQAQLRYKELASNRVTPNVSRVESSTQNYLNRNQQTVKPVVEEGEDDPEEGDDMQGAGNNFFSRQPVSNRQTDSNNSKSTSTTEAPSSEQQDTEEYCERICAIIQDDNEEIVCGSDGYMYTSEAQMECYASCLHIDVTIQAKGSCSAR